MYAREKKRVVKKGLSFTICETKTITVTKHAPCAHFRVYLSPYYPISPAKNRSPFRLHNIIIMYNPYTNIV